MAKGSLSQQLDEVVAALLTGRERASQVESVGEATRPRLDALAGLAEELRGLPRKSFKQTLKTELLGRAYPMTNTFKEAPRTKPVNPIREGFHSITPYLHVQGAARLVDFVKNVFGATETVRATGSAGGLHCEVRIGDSMLMIGGFEGMPIPEIPTALHVFLGEVDSIYQRALEAGATPIHPPADQVYGERVGSVTDPFGNQWYISKALPGSDFTEGLRTVNTYLHPEGASPFIDFLKRAFDAEEVVRYQSPEGIVHHARVRIGDSTLEMGDAHGPYKFMPTAIYLYVNDVDATYRQSLEAGGTSVQLPTDQPYGDRVAFVKDPFGNTWYLATHIKDLS
jgi:uncharacterized glyoxalase superfamily protein PhnB